MHATNFYVDLGNRCIAKEMKSMPDYERLLKTLKSCIRLKGVIMSDDSGKTWFVYRQDYLTHASTEYVNFNFAEGISLQGLPLKTDFEYLKELAETRTPNLMNDEDIQQLNLHEQLIYKIGVTLDIIGFKELQLDLPSELGTPPFIDKEKKPYKVRNREYDIKGIFQGQLHVIEVHDKGSLIQTLVKLNELKTAEKGLVLVNVRDEQNLKKELKRKQFKDLLYELKVFSKDETEKLYNRCKTFHKLTDLSVCREDILQKPPYIEQVL